MKKIGIITIVVLALAAVASAAPTTVAKSGTSKTWGDHHHQCVPEPLSMLALIPGVGMFIRRRSKKA